MYNPLIKFYHEFKVARLIKLRGYEAFLLLASIYFRIIQFIYGLWPATILQVDRYHDEGREMTTVYQNTLWKFWMYSFDIQGYINQMRASRASDSPGHSHLKCYDPNLRGVKHFLICDELFLKLLHITEFHGYNTMDMLRYLTWSVHNRASANRDKKNVLALTLNDIDYTREMSLVHESVQAEVVDLHTLCNWLIWQRPLETAKNYRSNVKVVVLYDDMSEDHITTLSCKTE